MNLLYRFAQLFSYSYFRTFHRFEIKGLHHVPTSGPFILASNHQSYFDPPALGCKMPRNLHYLARDTLFFWPLGSLIRKLNSIPVNRSSLDLATLRKVLGVLKSGDPLLLFPEGTRSINGRMGTGKKGIGLLLAKSRATIVPARISGGDKVLGKGMILPRIGRKLIVRYGEPLKFDDLDPGSTDPNRYESIAERVLEAIARI